MKNEQMQKRVVDILLNETSQDIARKCEEFLADNDDDEPFCYTCISSAYWQECENCNGEGFIVEEVDYFAYGCDEITEGCAICNGKGGWWICLGKVTHDLDPGSIHRIPLEEREVVR